MFLPNQLIYLVKVKTMRKIISNYVCFSKSPSFIIPHQRLFCNINYLLTVKKLHISVLNKWCWERFEEIKLAQKEVISFLDKNVYNKCIQMLFLRNLIINSMYFFHLNAALNFVWSFLYIVDHPVGIPDFFSEKNFCCSE